MSNKQLVDFARKSLKENLERLTEGEQHKFKWIYGKCTYDEAGQKSVDDVVDSLDLDHLDSAMQKVQNALN